ncbi:E3 SUMO-protein ligase MMS21-like isoform X2 [Zingiber officinale]|uniref:E3 SUMO-protein ligase MMS21-like isoform X2 n=1 Tax=Zingiber officinale TaxID=94328 RepID=UPI001C4DB273|nr:E3 SUMO-protein ligase MMS21-like isoform X2 [Zingiber officinale]
MQPRGTCILQFYFSMHLIEKYCGIVKLLHNLLQNVHHVGQPMPGEEQEDIVMTNTQNNILNMKCPLIGKPVTELQNPVRWMDCKHIYEKELVIHYISTKKPHPRCPVAGCPKILQVGRVVCDALLTIEIDEMRLASATNINSTMKRVKNG